MLQAWADQHKTETHPGFADDLDYVEKGQKEVFAELDWNVSKL